MKTRTHLFAVAMAVLTALNPVARAVDASQAAARKLLAEKGDSVVWLSAVMKISMTAAGSSDSPMNTDGWACARLAYVTQGGA